MTTQFWRTWGDIVTRVINSEGLPDTHECRDCPKHGGIGFDCHHLVRGRRMADRCQWCRDHGYEPGQDLPGQGAP
jgi:hypothetical protein